jgi:putative restriction endonuclease
MKPGIDQYERAGRAWPILVECSRNRRTITYGELASKLNLHRRACRFFLGKIQDYNKLNNLPPLQSLVIRKDTRKPGSGYTATTTVNIDKIHEEVFNFNWSKMNNPFQ